jgi:hypothetical protein
VSSKLGLGLHLTDRSSFLIDPETIALAATDGSDVVGWAWGTRQRHACGYSQVQLYEIEASAGHRRAASGVLLTQFLDIVRAEGHRRM